MNLKSCKEPWILKKAVGNHEFKKAVGNHEFKKAVGNYEFKKKAVREPWI